MRRHPGERLWAFAVWAVVGFFIVNLVAMIGSVVVNSFGTHWFNTWLPAGFTPQWYRWRGTSSSCRTSCW